MEKKEFDELMAGFQKEAKPFVEQIVKEAVSGMITPDQMKEQLENFATGKSVEDLTEAVTKQGLEITKLLDASKPSKNIVKTIPELLEENKDKLKALANKTGGGFTFVIPKTEITTASVTTPYQGFQIPGAGAMPHQGAVLRPLFPQVTLDPGMNGTVYYTDQTTDTNNAAGTAESDTFKESVAAWTGRSIVIDKITDSFPVTYEALRDQSFIAGEINRLLDTHLRVKEDNYLWDGTGVAPISEGIYTYTTAFDSAAYTGFEPEVANLYDLIAIMRVEITNGQGGTYQPNYVVMNPADTLKMKLNKDLNGQYVIPPFTNNDGQVVDGMPVIESESVTANTMLLGDFRFGTIYDDGGIEIEVGTTGTNFVEDVVTIKARKRMMLLVRTMYTGAFLSSSDIDADIANITKEVA